MPGGFDSIFNSIYTSIINKGSNLITLSGDFGSGKTNLLNKLNKQLLEENSINYSFSSSGFHASTLMEFSAHICASIQPNLSPNENFNFVENYYNLKRSTELLAELQSNNEDLYYRAKNGIRIFNNYDYYHNTKKEKNAIEDSDIEEVFEQKGDVRLISQTINSVIESFIVDILSIFYPKLDFQNSNIQDQKPKMLIVFDDVDHIKDFLDQEFLPEFLSYLFEKNFTEFKAYEFTLHEDQLRFTDLVDLKFIISTRTMINTEIDSENYKLEYLSKPEFESLLRVEIDSSKAEEIYNLTNGNYYLIDLFNKYSKKSGYDKESFHKNAFESFTKYMNNLDKELLIASSYFTEFESNALKSFTILRKHADEDFEYLKSKEIYEQIDKQIRLKPLVKEFVLSNFSELNPKQDKEYKKISEAYNNIKDLTLNYSQKEFDALRTLAYFDNFDNQNAIEKTFLEDSEIVFPLIEKNPELFEQKTFTKTLQKQLRDNLDNYNKFRDYGKYDKKKKLVSSIWKTYKASLKQMRSEYQHEINKINFDIKKIGKNNTEIQGELTSVNGELIEVENQLLEKKALIDKFSLKSAYPIIAGIFIVSLLGIISIIAFNQLKELFAFEVELSNVIRYSLLGFFVAMNIGTFRGMLKIIRSLSNKKKLKDLESEFKLIESAKEEIADKAKRLKADVNANKSKLDELGVDIINYNKIIKETDQKLEEAFI